MTAQYHTSSIAPTAISQRWIVLAVVLTAAFMAILDFNIVNVAIPTIQQSLHASFAQVQLVVAGYGLAYAVGLITGGRLGDMYGHRRLFLLGTLCFTITSTLCGFAPSIELLIAARILQGLAASLMFPQVLSIMQVNFHEKERDIAFSAYGAVLGLAFIAGYIFGGLFIAGNLFGLEWRPIFLVNLFFGCATLCAAWPLLQESRAAKIPQLDLPGVGVLSIGLGLLIYPLVAGRDLHWPWWTWGCIVAALFVLTCFVLYERWISLRRSPLLDLALFKDHTFVVGLLLALILFQSSGSFLFALALYLQLGMHDTALVAGLIFLSLGIGFLLASLASSKLVPLLGSHLLAAGALITVVGLLFVMLLVHTVSSHESFPFGVFIFALFIYGLGLGCVISPLFSIILAGIQNADAGAASGVLVTAQQIAIAIGVAIIGLFFFGTLGNNASNVSNELAPGLRAHLTTASTTPQEVDTIVLAFQRCTFNRANEADPALTPASCKNSMFSRSKAVARIVSTTIANTDFYNYSDALFTALFYNLALMGGTLLFVFLLPRHCHDAVRTRTPNMSTPRHVHG